MVTNETTTHQSSNEGDVSNCGQSYSLYVRMSCSMFKVIQEVVSALNSAKYDDSNLVMFSGLGNVFCSGIDLTYLISNSMDRKMAARKMVDALR